MQRSGGGGGGGGERERERESPPGYAVLSYSYPLICTSLALPL
jgi:hypothetical protein